MRPAGRSAAQPPPRRGFYTCGTILSGSSESHPPRQDAYERERGDEGEADDRPGPELPVASIERLDQQAEADGNAGREEWTGRNLMAKPMREADRDTLRHGEDREQ